MCERERLRRQSCLFHHVNVVERHVCTKWLRWQGKSDLLATAARLVCRCLRIKNLQAWLCLLAVLRVTLVSFKDCGLWRWLHPWRDTWRGYETLSVCDRQADLMRRKCYKSEILLYFDICRKVTAFGLVGFMFFFIIDSREKFNFVVSPQNCWLQWQCAWGFFDCWEFGIPRLRLLQMANLVLYTTRNLTLEDAMHAIVFGNRCGLSLTSSYQYYWFGHSVFCTCQRAK